MQKLFRSLVNYIKYPPHLTAIKTLSLALVFFGIIYVSVDKTTIVKLRNLAAVALSSCVSSQDHNNYIAERTLKLKEKSDTEARISILQTSTTNTVDTASLQAQINKAKSEMDSHYSAYNSYLSAANSYKSSADSYKSQAASYLSTANSYLSSRDNLRKPQNQRQENLYKLKFDQYNNDYNTYYGYYMTYSGYYNTNNSQYNTNYANYQTYLSKYNTAKATYDALQKSLGNTTQSTSNITEINTLKAKVVTLTSEINTLDQNIAKTVCTTSSTTNTTTNTSTNTRSSSYTADGVYIKESTTITGDKRSGEACLGNSDCSSELVCVLGMCAGGSYCGSDTDCATNNTSTGDICSTSKSVCIPSTLGACNSSSDCSTGSCFDGVCAQEDPRHPSCSGNYDCSGNQQCVSGTCQDATDGSCMSDSDCNSSDACVAGKCEDNTNSKDTNGDGVTNCCVCIIGDNFDDLQEEIDYCKFQYEGFSCDNPTYEIVTKDIKYPSYSGGYVPQAMFICNDGTNPELKDTTHDQMNAIIAENVRNNIKVHIFYNEHEDPEACQYTDADAMQLVAYGLSGSINMCGCNGADDLDEMRIRAHYMRDFMNGENINEEVVWTGNQNIAIPGQELFGEVCAGKYSFHINRKSVTEKAGTCPVEGAACPMDADLDDTIKCEDDKNRVVDYTCVGSGGWGKWREGNF